MKRKEERMVAAGLALTLLLEGIIIGKQKEEKQTVQPAKIDAEILQMLEQQDHPSMKEQLDQIIEENINLHINDNRYIEWISDFIDQNIEDRDLTVFANRLKTLTILPLDFNEYEKVVPAYWISRSCYFDPEKNCVYTKSATKNTDFSIALNCASFQKEGKAFTESYSIYDGCGKSIVEGFSTYYTKGAASYETFGVAISFLNQALGESAILELLESGNIDAFANKINEVLQDCQKTKEFLQLLDRHYMESGRIFGESSLDVEKMSPEELVTLYSTLIELTMKSLKEQPVLIQTIQKLRNLLDYSTKRLRITYQDETVKTAILRVFDSYSESYFDVPAESFQATVSLEGETIYYTVGDQKIDAREYMAYEGTYQDEEGILTNGCILMQKDHTKCYDYALQEVKNVTLYHGRPLDDVLLEKQKKTITPDELDPWNDISSDYQIMNKFVKFISFSAYANARYGNDDVLKIYMASLGISEESQTRFLEAFHKKTFLIDEADMAKKIFQAKIDTMEPSVSSIVEILDYIDSIRWNTYQSDANDANLAKKIEEEPSKLRKMFDRILEEKYQNFPKFSTIRSLCKNRNNMKSSLFVSEDKIRIHVVKLSAAKDQILTSTVEYPLDEVFVAVSYEGGIWFVSSANTDLLTGEQTYPKETVSFKEALSIPYVKNHIVQNNYIIEENNSIRDYFIDAGLFQESSNSTEFEIDRFDDKYIISGVRGFTYGVPDERIYVLKHLYIARSANETYLIDSIPEDGFIPKDTYYDYAHMQLIKEDVVLYEIENFEDNLAVKESDLANGARIKVSSLLEETPKETGYTLEKK